MLLSDPDPAFAAEVDTYISDESDNGAASSVVPTSPSPQTPQTPRTPQTPQTPQFSTPPNRAHAPVVRASNDSIHLHRQRLNRFHQDAKSFLSNAEANASAVLVHDHATSPHDPDDRRVHLDQLRLARFHRQAVSFLDRAYADEPSTLVTEEALSPAGLAAAHSRIHDRELLQRFHHEAMNFLDAAASVTSLSPSSQSSRRQSLGDPDAAHPSAATNSTLRSADRTSLRIERDKARLEQHYQDAMSFLNRAENGRSLVVEQELETATVDRLQLQKYAREAMSFLNKAFRGDSSILVDDDEGSGRTTQLEHSDDIKLRKEVDEPQYELDAQYIMDADSSSPSEDVDDANLFEKRKNQIPIDFSKSLQNGSHQNGLNMIDDNIYKPVEVPPSKRPISRGLPPARPPSSRRHHRSDEDQIAADRAALERYDEEFGDFLSKAYLDDSTIIVDDADDCETSGTEPGIHGHAKSQTASEHSGYPGSMTHDDDVSEDAFTDEEFQDAPVVRSNEFDHQAPRAAHHGPHSLNSSTDNASGANQTLQRRMEIFEREAAGYMEDVNVSEEEETDTEQAGETGEIRKVLDFPGNGQGAFPPSSSVDALQRNSLNSGHGVVDNMAMPLDFAGSDGESSLTKADEKSLSIVSLGSDPKAREENRIFKTDEAVLKHREIVKWGRYGMDNRTPGDEHYEAAHRSHGSSRRASKKFHPDVDVTMDLRLEDQSGRAEDWCGVQLKTSFYRQIPRGSTIKLRPRTSRDESWRGGYEGSPRRPDERLISLSALQRVEKERDVLMATLEEIVNERSMLAAQVSEMKAIFPRARGDRHQRNSPSSSQSSRVEDIDLAGELRDAHALMAKLTEEMEETLSILENRYQDALERAHKAEERCIRLESNAYRLHTEFASQGRRLSEALAEEQRLKGVVDSSEEEFMALRSKSEQDLIRIEEEYRVDSERAGARIRELTSEVETLQEKVKSESKRVIDSRGATANATRHLEKEMASLKRKLAESERVLAEERVEAKKKEELEATRNKGKADEEISKLQMQLRDVEKRSMGEAEKLGRELRKLKSDNMKLGEEAKNAEIGKQSVETELAEARRQQRGAEAEVVQIRTRYEESVREGISKLDQTAEIGELQVSLQGLKEGTSIRERQLEKQLEEFRARAEQAEAAATAAENGAKEAAEIAKLAQERSRSAIEAERMARQAAESDREAIASEWEEYQQQSKKKVAAAAAAAAAATAAAAAAASPVMKSSSRRGLRKSSSRNAKDAEKKKKDAKASASEDGHTGRKRTSNRPRLFG